MTKESIAKLCKKNDLYMTPHLNDVLYLHYQGNWQLATFAAIADGRLSGDEATKVTLVISPYRLSENRESGGIHQCEVLVAGVQRIHRNLRARRLDPAAMPISPE